MMMPREVMEGRMTEWVACDDLTIEPQLSNLFEIRDTTLKAITANMRVSQFDESQPIVVWETKEDLIVVDGHTRLRAARNCSLDFIAIYRHRFSGLDAALEYAISNQRDRRNWTDAELLRCIEAVDRRKRRGPVKKDSVSSDTKLGDSRDETALIVGTSVGQINRARAVLSDPAAKQAVLSGKQSLNQASREAAKKKVAKAQVMEIETEIIPSIETRGLFIPPVSIIEELRRNSKVTFNAQKTDNIEWARWSWNPVTGCLHNCEFCYAREIAERFYPQKFAPTFLPDRLAAPRNTDVPSRASDDVGWKNVFVCSMADLWGKWVPREIIDLVLRETVEQPQWNYLFLSKFPARFEEFAHDFKPNTWVGTTVTCQDDVSRAEQAFFKLRKAGHKGVRWVSVEPMLGPVEFNTIELFDWIVIGGQSATNQPDGYVPSFNPPMRWWLDLIEAATARKIPVYLKTNLFSLETRLREYPSN